MKTLVLLLCGLAAASAASADWEHFKQTFGKKYENAADEAYRMSVFLAKLKQIKEHNEFYDRGEKTYWLKINKLSDMTHEEIREQMTGTPRRMHPLEKVIQSKPTKALAAEVDWRDQGAVTPVKDQAGCDSSYAFSAVAALEGAYFLKTGSLITFSEQQLVDCSLDYGNYGCDGGWPYVAYQSIIDKNGINTGDSYPYLGYESQCAYDPTQNGTTISSYTDIPVGDEVALAQATQYVGPISVCIDVVEDTFLSYGGGVYYEPNCDSWYVNHAVTVVGYGREGSDAYWIVKNSWGTWWGESGYIRMAKDRNNHCAIATYAVYPNM